MTNNGIEQYSFVKLTKGSRKGLVAKVLFFSDNNEKAYISFIEVGAGSGWAKIKDLEPYKR